MCSHFRSRTYKAYEIYSCAQVRRLADAHAARNALPSQDAFAALHPSEQKCTPRRKRSILLAFSALAANDLLSPLTNYPMSLSKQNVLIQQTKGRYTPSLLLCSETTQSYELSAQTYHKRVMCSHFRSRTYKACHMPRARKRRVICPVRASSAACRRSRCKKRSPFRKTLSPPYIPPNKNVHLVANALSFSRPPPLRRMTCCLHRQNPMSLSI